MWFPIVLWLQQGQGKLGQPPFEMHETSLTGAIQLCWGHAVRLWEDQEGLSQD